MNDRFWRKADKKIPMAFDLVAVGVLMLLYPHGTESLKVLTVAFFVGYVPLQMISDPENAAGNQFSTVAVLGSFAATLLWNGPLGVFEKPPFDAGTRVVAEAVGRCPGFTVAGGGETIARRAPLSRGGLKRMTTRLAAW